MYKKMILIDFNYFFFLEKKNAGTRSSLCTLGHKNVSTLWQQQFLPYEAEIWQH